MGRTNGRYPAEQKIESVSEIEWVNPAKPKQSRHWAARKINMEPVNPMFVSVRKAAAVTDIDLSSDSTDCRIMFMSNPNFS